MTRKIALLLGALMTLSLSAANASGVGDAGCGLGHLAWQGKNGKLAQVSAATTNGTFYSQTFGITTGTSGCTASGLVRADKEQEYFANVNRDTLNKEISQGQGDNLNALAALMGCNPESMRAFGRTAQKNYSNIFTSANTTGTEMLNNLRAVIAKDSALSRSCSINNTAMN